MGSPVNVALDGARLGSRVDRTLDAGHGWVPCVINVSRFKLDLNNLPALKNNVRG
jgi:hypothetical protein